MQINNNYNEEQLNIRRKNDSELKSFGNNAYEAQNSNVQSHEQLVEEANSEDSFQLQKLDESEPYFELDEFEAEDEADFEEMPLSEEEIKQQEMNMAKKKETALNVALIGVEAFIATATVAATALCGLAKGRSSVDSTLFKMEDSNVLARISDWAIEKYDKIFDKNTMQQLKTLKSARAKNQEFLNIKNVTFEDMEKILNDFESQCSDLNLKENVNVIDIKNVLNTFLNTKVFGDGLDNFDKCSKVHFTNGTAKNSLDFLIETFESAKNNPQLNSQQKAFCESYLNVFHTLKKDEYKTVIKNHNSSDPLRYDYLDTKEYEDFYKTVDFSDAKSLKNSCFEFCNDKKFEEIDFAKLEIGERLQSHLNKIKISIPEYEKGKEQKFLENILKLYEQNKNSEYYKTLNSYCEKFNVDTTKEEARKWVEENYDKLQKNLLQGFIRGIDDTTFYALALSLDKIDNTDLQSLITNLENTKNNSNTIACIKKYLNAKDELEKNKFKDMAKLYDTIAKCKNETSKFYYEQAFQYKFGLKDGKLDELSKKEYDKLIETAKSCEDNKPNASYYAQSFYLKNPDAKKSALNAAEAEGLQLQTAYWQKALAIANGNKENKDYCDNAIEYFTSGANATIKGYYYNGLLDNASSKYYRQLAFIENGQRNFNNETNKTAIIESLKNIINCHYELNKNPQANKYITKLIEIYEKQIEYIKQLDNTNQGFNKDNNKYTNYINHLNKMITLKTTQETVERLMKTTDPDSNFPYSYDLKEEQFEKYQNYIKECNKAFEYFEQANKYYESAEKNMSESELALNKRLAKIYCKKEEKNSFNMYEYFADEIVRYVDIPIVELISDVKDVNKFIEDIKLPSSSSDKETQYFDKLLHTKDEDIQKAYILAMGGKLETGEKLFEFEGNDIKNISSQTWGEIADIAISSPNAKNSPYFKEMIEAYNSGKIDDVKEYKELIDGFDTSYHLDRLDKKKNNEDLTKFDAEHKFEETLSFIQPKWRDEAEKLRNKILDPKNETDKTLLSERQKLLKYMQNGNDKIVELQKKKINELNAQLDSKNTDYTLLICYNKAIEILEFAEKTESNDAKRIYNELANYYEDLLTSNDIGKRLTEATNSNTVTKQKQQLAQLYTQLQKEEEHYKEVKNSNRFIAEKSEKRIEYLKEEIANVKKEIKELELEEEERKKKLI